MPPTTIADKFDELKTIVSNFILEQRHVNENVVHLSECMDGNGKEGVRTTLVKINGRLEQLDRNDSRRQKLVDTLVGGVALTLLLEIIRLVFKV